MANEKIVNRENLKAFRQKLDNRYAKPDGNYPTLTAGLADNLTPYSKDSGAEQTNPFISNGTGTNNNTEIVTVGDYALFKEKQGHTLAVNQWIPNNQRSYANSDVDTKTKLNVSVQVFNGSTFVSTLLNVNVETIGQKFYKVVVPNNVNGNKLRIKHNGSQADLVMCNFDMPVISSHTIEIFFNLTSNDPTTVGGLTTENQYCIDLTQMFNGDITQDLLDNPSNLFRYYNGSLDYNTGSLENANGVKLVSTGRNLFNGNWTNNSALNVSTGATGTQSGFSVSDFIRIIPNKDFYYRIDATDSNMSGTHICYYDKDKNFIIGYIHQVTSNFWNRNKTAPSNAQYVRFDSGNTYINSVCVSLYYTPEQGGEGYDKYFPYEEPYVVDTGSEVLYAFDKKNPSGVIERNTNDIDLGDLTWTPNASFQNTFNGALPVRAKATGEPSIIKAICSKYQQFLSTGVGTENQGFAISSDGLTVYIRDINYNDVTTFKTAMSGQKLQYEIADASKTTEQGTPFAENLPINDYGMLYWLDSSDNLVGIPQGAKIFFPTNYKGFVDDMYMRTDGDASKYVIDTELSASETQRDTVDTQLKNAIGGTLRQLLATTQSIDFNNTNFADLGLYDWTYDDVNGRFICFALSSVLKAPATDGTIAKILCSKYKEATINAVKITNLTIGVGDTGNISIKDTAYTNATTFKNAMKGVLLAYEKA